MFLKDPLQRCDVFFFAFCEVNIVEGYVYRVSMKTSR